MEPRIQEITNELLDQVAGSGEMDAIRDLAYPLPVTVIAELLGIPTELREDFKRWSDALVSGDEETTEEERQALFQEIGGMFGYYSPVKTMTRYATTETTLGDQRIEAGQVILPWFGSANRDEAEFPDADRFDIEREPNRHLAFGRGIHFCLGAPLARLEAKTALNAMLNRLPGEWHVADVPLERIKSFIVFGVKNLPLTWGH